MDVTTPPYWSYDKMELNFQSGINRKPDLQNLRPVALVFWGFRPYLRSNIIDLTMIKNNHFGGPRGPQSDWGAVGYPQI